MAFVTWVPNANGDWDTASNWSGGVLPTSADTVVISTTTEHTITHSTGDDFAGSLSVGNDLFAMTGGTLTVVGAVAMANGFSMSGGISSMGTTATITGTFDQTGGSLSVGGTLTVDGEAELQGGTLAASTIVQASGPVVLSNYTLGGQAQIQNTTVIYQTGNITLGNSSGVDALIATAAGATYDFANAVSVAKGAATAQITSAGTLAALAGTGASSIGVSVSSTGVVSAAVGSSLAFEGPITSLSGTITGAGTVYLAGGITTVTAGTAVNVGTFSIYNAGTDLALGGNQTISGSFSQSGGSTLSLAGYTLTLTGSASFFLQSSATPLIAGAGTLITKGSTSISGTASGLSIGSTVAWDNYGTVTDSQSFQIGTSASGTASVVDETNSVFDLAANGVTLTSGSTPVSALTNAGTLAMIANGGTDYLKLDVTSTRLITSAASDNLEFDGAANSISGSISGPGQVSFANAGTTTLTNTKITVGTLALYNAGTNLDIAGTVSDSGSYTQSAGTTLVLNASTFTLTGLTAFQQNSNGTPIVTGTGTLVTKGTTSLIGTGTALEIGASATWSNTGTVFDTAPAFEIGNTSGLSATVINASGAVFDLLANGVSITNGSTPYSSLVNAGTLEMASNGGTAYVHVASSSTGTILVLQGDNLEFDNPSTSFAGTITGAGQLSVGSGSGTIAGGTVINIGTLAEYNNGTSLVLTGNVTDLGNFAQSYGSTLALSGNTLTLAGNAQFELNSQSPLVTGPGTLVTDGVTSLGVTGTTMALVIGGTAAWDNDGTVLDYQSFEVGNSSSAAASVVNEAGATFDLVGSIGIINGSTPISSFTNAGLLEMTKFGGASSMNEVFTNTGTVLAQGGRMNFLGPVSGTGALDISAGGELGFSSTVASTANVDFLDATGSMSLTLTTPTSFGAEISGFVQGDTIDLTSISSTSVTETFSGGVLTFTNNTSHAVVAALHFTNSPNFIFTSDGNGGTLIGDPHK